MSDTKIAQAFKLIEGAENNIRAAKSVLADMAGGIDMFGGDDAGGGDY